MSAGAEISGSVVSTIVTTWVTWEILPDMSVTVHVTVVLPSGNVIGSSLVIDSIPTLSETTSSPSST